MPERLWIRAGRVFTPSEVIPDGAVIVEDGRIAAVGPSALFHAPRGARTLDVGDRIVAPGFVDLHVHGGGGHALGSGVDETLAVARRLAGAGTTSFLATLAGFRDLEALLRGIGHVVEAREREADGAQILGIHLEGPFLSPARRGAHSPDTLRPPSVDEAERVVDAARGALRLMTVAPELDGALDVIRTLARRGVVASVGHTDAGYEEAVAGFEAGATYATHTYNAMRGLHHRDPGAVGAVLTRDDVRAEVIADGHHVHPAAVEVFLRAKGTHRAVLVTDNVALAGEPDGAYERGGRTVVLREGRAALPDGTLAGSVLPMNGMVANAARFAGLPLNVAVGMASRNPAEAIGVDHEKGSLAPGKDADLVVLDDDARVYVTMVRGRVVFQSQAFVEGRR